MRNFKRLGDYLIDIAEIFQDAKPIEDESQKE